MKKNTTKLLVTLSMILALQPMPAMAAETDEPAAAVESVVETTADTENVTEIESFETLETTAETMEETEAAETETKAAEETVEETETEAEAYQAGTVEAFVERLYTCVLNRQSDPTGQKTWITALKEGKMTGAQVAQGFIDSNELKKRNLSDAEYIDVLYKTFFNRTADPSGQKTWTDLLTNGMSRLYVFKGFAESTEFENLCKEYGIQRGNANLTAACDQNIGVTTFVSRCYHVFLGRKADAVGLNSWCSQILEGKISAKDAAYGFVFSNEFQNNGLNNEAFIQALYRGLFNRAADAPGLKDWTGRLQMGEKRATIFYGFADSQEFRALAAGYGLKSDWESTPVVYIQSTDAAPVINSSNIAQYNGTTYCTRKISATDTLKTLPFTPLKYKEIASFAFYKDEVYYLCKENAAGGFNTAIVRCKVNGSDAKVIYEGKGDEGIFFFFKIENGKLYYRDYEYDIAANKLTKTSKVNTTNAGIYYNGLNGFKMSGTTLYTYDYALKETKKQTVPSLKIAGVTNDYIYCEGIAGGNGCLYTYDISTGAIKEVDKHALVDGGIYFNY